VARLLGIFLLVTAELKIHGLSVDPYGQENFLRTPWMQLLAVEVEVLLASCTFSAVLLFSQSSSESRGRVCDQFLNQQLQICEGSLITERNIRACA
jgi:hypothetical protein